MPRSHICTSCGQELGNLAPTFEAHYGLPVISCPRCGLTHVRTFARDRAARWWRKLVAAAAYSGVNLVGSFLTIALSSIVVLALARHMHQYAVTPLDVVAEVARGGQNDPDSVIFSWWGDHGGGRVLIYICVCVLMGVSSVVLFRHWRRWAVALTMLLAMHAAIYLPHVINMIAYHRRIAYPGQTFNPPFSREFLGGTWLAFELLWYGLVFAVPGVILGRMARRAQESMKRSVLRKYSNAVRREKGLA